jgi:hypothetical protein
MKKPAVKTCSKRNKMEFDFFEPIDTETLELIHGLTSQQLGSKVVFHTKEQFPDLDKINIACGVLENRGAGKGQKLLICLQFVKWLYVPCNWDASIADLGNIHRGIYRRLYFALRKVASDLIEKNYTHSYRWFPKT